jgi:hypothetical protein
VPINYKLISEMKFLIHNNIGYGNEICEGGFGKGFAGYG